MFRIKILGLDIYGCREAKERLDAYVDRELAPDETKKVAQHLKICHECARKFKFEQELVDGLREKVEHVDASGAAELGALKERIGSLLDLESASNEI